MNIFAQGAQGGVDAWRAFKIGLGGLLLGCGLFIVFEVLSTIYQCLHDGAALGIMKPFLDASPEARMIVTPHATIELPRMAFLGSGYFLVMLFLTAAASLAGTLIRGAVKLIQDDPARALERLRQALERAQAK